MSKKNNSYKRPQIRNRFHHGQFVILRLAKTGTLRINLPEKVLNNYGWNKGDYLRINIDYEGNNISFEKVYLPIGDKIQNEVC